MVGATWNSCRLGTRSVYTIQPCTSLKCYFIQKYIGRVHGCLAVTCHQHFWQNDRDLLRSTEKTRCWTGSEIKVSTESWPWKRNFSSRSCVDSNTGPFDHDSGSLTTKLTRLSNHQTNPAPLTLDGENPPIPSLSKQCAMVSLILRCQWLV